MVTNRMLKYASRATESEFLHCYKKFYGNVLKAKEDLAFHRYNDCVSALYDAMEFFWKALRHLESHDIMQLTQHLPKRDKWDSFMPKLVPSLVSDSELNTLFRVFDRYNPSWEHNPRDRNDARYAHKQFDFIRSQQQLSDIEANLASILSRINRQICLSGGRLTVGILDGYVGLDRQNEKPCGERPWADYQNGGIEGWLRAFTGTGSSRASVAVVAVTEMSPKLSIVVNPFGEAYPELPSTVQTMPAYQIIKEYIYAGGVFVTAGGNPFHYLYDVREGKLHDASVVIPDIPVGVLGYDDQGRILFERATIIAEPLLTRDFGVATTMTTRKHRVPFLTKGYQKSEDKKYWNCQTDTSQIQLFRSLVQHSSAKITPLLRATLSQEEVFPVAFVKYGFGLFLHVGLALNKDRKKEFEIATASVIEGLIENFENYFR